MALGHPGAGVPRGIVREVRPWTETGAAEIRGGRLAGDGEPREIFENVSLLRTCGLEQPVLYRVGRVLGLAAPPHTVEELEQEWKP